jgi:uncharacterized membrane protein YoaK (UPF0700 family)
VERFDISERLFVGALAALAGYVDAVGFVQSKGFFVSFMSGNTTRLGVGIAASYSDAFAAAGLISSFIIGVVLGSLLGRWSERHRVSLVMLSVAALLAVAAFLGRQQFLLISLSFTALAMGAENATLEREGRVRVGLTYMTGSVVRLGQALADAISGKRKADWSSPLLLWVSFIMGAMTGALAASAFGFAALSIGAAVAATLAIVGQSLRGLIIHDD